MSQIETQSKSVTDIMEIGRDVYDRNAIARTVTLVGGAMVTILLTAVVLNSIFDSVNVGSGPFSSIGTELETTGVAAISLLVVGLIVVAANRIMGIFGGGGMG